MSLESCTDYFFEALAQNREILHATPRFQNQSRHLKTLMASTQIGRKDVFFDLKASE